MSDQPAAFLSFAGKQLTSEHGILVIASSTVDHEGYWEPALRPGVVVGDGWARVSGGINNVSVDLAVEVRLGEGPAPAPGDDVFVTPDDTMMIADPMSSFGVTWPLPTGVYRVHAEITDLPGESSMLEPLQAWRVDLSVWPD